MCAALGPLGVFCGPLGGAALAFVLAAIAVRLRPDVAARVSQILVGLSPRWLFAVSALVYIALGQYYVARLQAAGDEPHYLVMAQSLWQEQDLDLRDNFERQDYAAYAPPPLAPHYGEPREDGRPFPSHSPGLPLILAPVYALGGRRACVALLGLAAAALALETRRLAARLTDDRRALFYAWAVAAGPPLASYAFHVYTEVVSGLLLAVALRLLLGAPSLSAALLASSAASFLPWLHVKMIPAAAALGLLALWRLRGRPLAAFLGIAAAAAIAMGLYYLHVFGRATPLALYGGVPHETENPSVLRAVLGLLFDRSFGLLPHAPVFILALAGMAALVRVRDARPYLLVAAAVVAPVVVWRMWWGGMCPPARFLVPMVPLAGVAVALRLARSPRGLARGAPWLCLAGAALMLFMIATPSDALLLNRRDNPTRVWARLSGATEVADYLPSMVRASRRDWMLASGWALFVALVLAADARAAAPRPTRPSA